MTVRIGKLLPDGQIRHIEVFEAGEMEEIAPRLKNFYSTEKRLDALLDLGNLYRLGATPYGKYKWYDDLLHCHAAIRDDNGSKKKHEAAVSCNREFFTQSADVCFLHENGNWLILVGKRTISIANPEIIRQAMRRPLENLEVYSGKSASGFSKLHENFDGWKAIEDYAGTQSRTLHVFRHNRLVKTINHSQIKKETA
jgi:hypothetical protein